MAIENETVIKIGQLNFQGNIIDDGWIKNLTYENGKPNMNAIMILSEIVYWYRPVIEKDELTGRILGVKKKFKSDMLQKSYQALADRFGISKRQAKAACDYLKDRGLIRIEFRDIVKDGHILNNVMFVEPIPEKIKEISSMYTQPIIEEIEDSGTIPPPLTTECTTLLQQNVGGSHNQMYHPPTIECKTNTETTTKTTTETNNNNSASEKNAEDKNVVVVNSEENNNELLKDIIEAYNQIAGAIDDDFFNDLLGHNPSKESLEKLKEAIDYVNKKYIEKGKKIENVPGLIRKAYEKGYKNKPVDSVSIKSKKRKKETEEYLEQLKSIETNPEAVEKGLKLLKDVLFKPDKKT